MSGTQNFTVVSEDETTKIMDFPKQHIRVEITKGKKIILSALPGHWRTKVGYDIPLYSIPLRKDEVCFGSMGVGGPTEDTETVLFSLREMGYEWQVPQH